jgi:hypothetical protein
MSVRANISVVRPQNCSRLKLPYIQRLLPLGSGLVGKKSEWPLSEVEAMTHEWLGIMTKINAL